VKPLLFGYQRAALGSSPDEIENGRRILTAFAAAEGYALGEIFLEHDVNKPLSALAALIDAARRTEVTAVVVPTLADLGRLPRVRVELAKRLQREAGVRVLTAQSMSAAAEPMDDIADADGSTTGRPERTAS
jgi:citrate lyase beta subunit